MHIWNEKKTDLVLLNLQRAPQVGGGKRGLAGLNLLHTQVRVSNLPKEKGIAWEFSIRRVAWPQFLRLLRRASSVNSISELDNHQLHHDLKRKFLKNRPKPNEMSEWPTGFHSEHQVAIIVSSDNNYDSPERNASQAETFKTRKAINHQWSVHSTWLS